MTCPVCSQPLDPAAGTTHPMCAPWADAGENPDAAVLKHRLMEVIRWAEERNPRTQQLTIGPSEIGSVCDRQVGYRLAQYLPVNTGTDPWPAIVGTSIHAWLDKAVKAWNEAHPGVTDWLTEQQLHITDLVSGTSDLFHVPTGTVIDHKGAGNEIMRQVKKDGPKHEHRVQVQLYGLGYHQLGYRVKKVAVVYYPRAGWLRDSYVWVDDFSPDQAYAALDRLGSIAKRLVELGVIHNPHRWEEVTPTPTNSCGLCDWYDPGRESDRGADDTGCPGR